MKERPVILNSEMVRAILDGRKTQTRRVIAVQPESNQFGLLRISDSTKHSDIGKYHWAESNATGTHQRSALFSCPFGQVGDRLWVRETFMDLTGTGIEATTGKFEGFAYRADTPAGSYGDEVRKEYGLKWAPSLHMPRKACRILLEITAVRVERLNDISDGDAISEGCSISDMKSGDCVADVFARLWSSIYGVDSWNANPWVWVIEFRRMGDSAREVDRG
ncbi:hypothetical protein ACTVKE_14735 [Serratia marcescens]|uniref:hypothetical protein n=1 Tax=Serratia marcescens TaxID=615 RepID=UPI003FA7E118